MLIFRFFVCPRWRKPVPPLHHVRSEHYRTRVHNHQSCRVPTYLPCCSTRRQQVTYAGGPSTAIRLFDGGCGRANKCEPKIKQGRLHEGWCDVVHPPPVNWGENNTVHGQLPSDDHRHCTARHHLRISVGFESNAIRAYLNLPDYIRYIQTHRSSIHKFRRNYILIFSVVFWENMVRRG